MGAAQVTGKPLREQQIVFLGAGSAAIGVADYLRSAMVVEGLSDAQARSRFWIVNSGGLLHTGRGGLNQEQAVFAQPVVRIAEWPRSAEQGLETGGPGLADVIRSIDATVLIGLSTAFGAFSEPIVREMARKTGRPIIFPLSNPTTRSEATAGDLIRWTAGRALVATGSPFGPVECDGRRIPIGQCNNVYIFPAVGLGVVAARARRITDSMMLAAAQALGRNSPTLKDPRAPLLPALQDIRTIARDIAVAVGVEAQRAGVSPAMAEDELRERVRACQWVPEYQQHSGPAAAIA